MNVVWWVVVPYIALTVFVVGHVWRWRTDQFGWTTRTSQVLESRLLRLGSPLFHLGAFAAIGGHVLGLLVPKAWTEAVGVDEHLYHLVSVSAGTVAGVMVVAGLGLLLARRLTRPRVRRATTRTDKLLFAVLAVVIALGMSATIGANLLGGGYDYRADIAVWFRGVLTFRPDPALMADVPLVFQLHALSAWLLAAIWPFTRLVHVWSAPIAYLWRPYVVYRRRTPRAGTERAGVR
ncbi:respiratory nitrate reductase subunit gamma [Nonomuraea sp. NN258]|uniref:respiratory nitrate reductase subunit gamma n=1 Tax=Nonomuraea antri TaxID=2730852 RepID=UPI0015683102|nr:respiratory nitrate reductase subunit gamma [Nonomuraea antri]NRQ37075.1 respiratory nitrate reductase subunit gamma [Nonomuraea antri]